MLPSLLSQLSVGKVTLNSVWDEIMELDDAHKMCGLIYMIACAAGRGRWCYSHGVEGVALTRAQFEYSKKTFETLGLNVTVVPLDDRQCLTVSWS